MNKKIVSVLTIILIVFFTGCSEDPQDSNEKDIKSGRLLGFDILNTTENGSFYDNVTAAKAMGLEFITLHVHWSSIETAPGVYTDPAGALEGLSTAAAAYGLKLALIISPIDLPGRATPADLNSTGFAEDDMINRFKACLDYILANWVDKSLLTSISVGNEIDAYNWTGNGDSPADYATFLWNIEAHLDGYGVDTAFTGTHSGLISGTLKDQGVWTSMATVVDAIHVTYYPMTSDFQVEDPDVVEQDLQTLVDEFDKIKGADQSTGSSIPLYLQEVGYQTSSVCGSSNEKQAEFFYNFFQAWDKHGDRIPQASILRLCDVSQSSAEQTAADYGIPGNQGFIEYIRTLGLRTYPGTGVDKPAAAVIREETEKCGW